MWRPAWGKIDPSTGVRHHLAHHCADVAAVLRELLRRPTIRVRVERAKGGGLSDEEVSCLAALAFLHDIGKIAPAFQAKGWPSPQLTPKGHLDCGRYWLGYDRLETALDGNFAKVADWPGIASWFDVLFAHHGFPVPEPTGGGARTAFPRIDGYDWIAEEAALGQAWFSWFPEIETHQAPAPDPALAHFFCGLLALADWIGSDQRAFPYEAEFRSDYYPDAVARARERLCEIGLDTSGRALAGPAVWPLLSEHPAPRRAQAAVGAVSPEERLILLEAETGAGKTEAALWRFARLYEGGEVDALYFALPTRAAARQLHRRVNVALSRMFDDSPEALLAIPGQIVSGAATGRRLPGFEVQWDDAGEAPARWAAEHGARYLAAQIAVGTVDQAMLAGLQVKHAHLRGSALARSLLVIDEVHASDAWMTAIQQNLTRSHLALGGHVMLMSATLGAAARAAWRGETLPDARTAAESPYPAVWTATDCVPVSAEGDRAKTVRIDSHDGWSATDAAALAIRDARRGARVLVIRNTVDRARETWAACRAEAADLLMSVAGLPALHHGRFAAEDPARHDRAGEAALGNCRDGGGIVIGTQTLEQSLDIDADFLVTDLCPVDVLLQRIGRLHRHARDRPEGFAEARVVVLAPKTGLDPLTRRAENGLGAYDDGASLSGVYPDLASAAATLEQIDAHDAWRIPEMNRALVEAATHPEALDAVARARGWEAYHGRVTGKALAERMVADLVVLDRSQPLPQRYPSDEKIRTRLGEEGVLLTLPEGAIGPFGGEIRRIALPPAWSKGLTTDEAEVSHEGDHLRVTVSDRVFRYDCSGLARGSDS
ncbi:MAG: CRISPR-associated helicase Cas3' [Pseudomonadota bacterium]